MKGIYNFLAFLALIIILSAIVQGEHFTCDEKVQRTCVGEDIVWCCDLKEKCGVTPVTCWPSS
ncbi:hypothetical protein C2G38_2174926 [Gigaspora rosea]|uniref:CBM1 domain-containing protein n=1 Tax=Gigaspora rosea TaxID=44941 RepID=A0A397VL65_9GLOM|nr:hypothetical protein C2G38_2174926 [Gigaspora rosea]